MDLLTHAVLTRKLIGKQPCVLLASVGSDVPFYLTYPGWAIAQGQAAHALSANE
jgi:hypothetical protein